MFNPTPPFVQPQPPSPGQGSAADDVRRWDEYLATIQESLAASSGFDRLKLERQYEDATKARDNAMAIARLQAETSRYGTDVGREIALAQRQESARQFDARHGLELAEAYTRYAQTPDMMWAQKDFLSALGQVGQGGGPQPLASQGAPSPKTWESFAALSGWGNVPAVQSGGGGGGGGGGSAAPGGGGGGGGGGDPRVSAANAVMRAIPPSEGPGGTGQDWAALDSIRNLYFAARPGQVERLGAQRRKIAEAGLARLGYDPRLVEEERRRSLPGQGSARMA